jgi:UDP-N-acetylmuramoyl-tripeptide--D-alanyl-D-alanine ligase
MKAGSAAIINGDNEELVRQARKFPLVCYYFGYDPSCHFRILSVERQDNGINIEANLLGRREHIFCPIPARQLAGNVMAALAAAVIHGIDLDICRSQLLKYLPGDKRLNVRTNLQGGIVINDTYNANPVSMMAALEVGKTLARKGRTVAVLGDMLELGAYEVSGHWEVGKRAAELGIDLLVAVGERSRDIARGAVEAGMNSASVKHFNNKQDSLTWLKENINKEDVVLFKASRGMQLETLLEQWMA